MATKRILYITDDIALENGYEVIIGLRKLEAEDPISPIVLFINSYGGRVDVCLAIVDVMNDLSCPVYTVGYGQVMSAGAFILANGSKGNRSLAPNARVLLHHPNGNNVLGDTDTGMAVFLAYRDMVDVLIAEASERSIEEVSSKMSTDYYLSATEAVEFGIVDTVL
jgi:ATP-dependent Clp protease protease subunit